MSSNKNVASKKRSTASAVIYLGHMPYGFFEPELRQYFTQFGYVKRIKVARSRKTSRPKGYGFVEFHDPRVAKIAADTMNNYLMFDKLLKCHVVEKEKIHKDLFKNCNKPFEKFRGPQINVSNMNRKKTVAQQEKANTRLQHTLAAKNKKLADMGIQFSFPLPKKSKNAADMTSESNYTMVVDSEDDEISLKTPPKSVRKLKNCPSMKARKTSGNVQNSPAAMKKSSTSVKSPASKKSSPQLPRKSPKASGSVQNYPAITKKSPTSSSAVKRSASKKVSST